MMVAGNWRITVQRRALANAGVIRWLAKFFKAMVEGGNRRFISSMAAKLERFNMKDEILSFIARGTVTVTSHHQSASNYSVALYAMADS